MVIRKSESLRLSEQRLLLGQAQCSPNSSADRCSCSSRLSTSTGRYSRRHTRHHRCAADRSNGLCLPKHCSWKKNLADSTRALMLPCCCRAGGITGCLRTSHNYPISHLLIKWRLTCHHSCIMCWHIRAENLFHPLTSLMPNAHRASHSQLQLRSSYVSCQRSRR